MAEPWYRESKRCWYVTLDGRKIRLAKEKDVAWKKWHLLASGQVEPRRAVQLSVRDLHAAYIEDHQHRAAPSTHKTARMFLARFVQRFGTRQAATLKRREVEAFLREHTKWADSSKREAGTRILALFNWAVRAELLPTNPLTGLHKPLPSSRGATALIGEAEHTALVQAAPAYLQDILTALHDTGCRPGELCRVTAQEFNPELACWLLPQHKTAHTTGKPRIVWLTTRVADICRRLTQLHPTGGLFRTARGRPFTPHYLARLLRFLRDRLSLPSTLTAYGYRHTFATDALADGVPDAHVAELLGHRGTTMLHKHYAHLLARTEVLKAALATVRKGGAA